METNADVLQNSFEYFPDGRRRRGTGINSGAAHIKKHGDFMDEEIDDLVSVNITNLERFFSAADQHGLQHYQVCTIKNKAGAAAISQTIYATNGSVTDPYERQQMVITQCLGYHGTFLIYAYKEPYHDYRTRHERVTSQPLKGQCILPDAAKAASIHRRTKNQNGMTTEEHIKLIRDNTRLEIELENLREQKKAKDNPWAPLIQMGMAVAGQYLQKAGNPISVGQPAYQEPTTYQPQEYQEQEQKVTVALDLVLVNALSDWQNVDPEIDLCVVIPKLVEMAKNQPDTYKMAKGFILG
jgi:hypothetical protein